MFRGFFRKQISRAIGSVISKEIFRFIGMGNPIYKEASFDNFIKEGYMGNADVYSIIDKICKTCSSIEWTLNEVVNKKELRHYKQINNAATIKSEIYRTKALKEIPEHRILDLLEHPNNIQGYTEFLCNYVGFKLTTGNALINGVAPDFGKNKGLFQELWLMPPQLTDIVAGGWGEPIKGYRLNITYNRRHDIPAENVLHSRYFNPEYANGAYLWGISPLKAAFKNIAASNSADTARVKSFINNGAMGIISGDARDESMAMSGDEVKAVEEKYREKFGGTENINKVLFTAANVRWYNMGMSPVDLAIIESKKLDLRTLCNIYGVQSQLFNDPENKTYNNQEEAKKSLITEVVMPIMNDLRDELNSWLVKPYSLAEGKTYWLDLNWKNVSVLQDNFKEMAATLEKTWWMSPNQRRTIQGMDVMPDPAMDKIYIPSSLVLLEDAGKSTSVAL